MTVQHNTAPSDDDFDWFLEDAVQEATPDIAEQLRAGLKKRYDRPPVHGMELCLHRNVPLAKARQILFFPREDDMRLYPALLAMPPPGAPDTHPQHAVQVSALASMYLVHSKSWERVRPFIEAGGLKQLAAALAHPNPYLASQAMSSLLHIMDEALFPWHDPPLTPDGRGPRQGPFALVWRSMFELNAGGVFLPTLLAHYRTPPAFPGASLMALRLFAFYVSWMRKHFTQDGRLCLSPSLLELLKQWSTDGGVAGEERKLAAQLYKDFSRFPPAQEPLMPPSSDSDSEAAAAGGRPRPRHHLGGLSADDEEPATSVASERTQINSGASTYTEHEGELLKQRGNEAYNNGDFTPAIQLYSAALDALVPAAQLPTEGPRRASYHLNRAAAYMGRAAVGRLREGDADTVGLLEGVDHGSEGALDRHYEAAALDCDRALEMQPVGRAAAKALLRKSRALLQLGRREEAVAAARTGLDRCDSATDGPVATLRRELMEMQRAATPALVRRPRLKEEEAGGRAVVGMDEAEEGGAGRKTTEVNGGGGAFVGAGSSGIDWNAMD